MASNGLESGHLARLQELEAGIKAEEFKATFACGGKLFIQHDTGTETKGKKEKPTEQPTPDFIGDKDAEAQDDGAESKTSPVMLAWDRRAIFPTQDRKGKLVKAPADAEQATLDCHQEHPAYAPITVRFGPHGSGSKLVLPTASPRYGLRGQKGAQQSGDQALQQLIAACDPASFGVGGKEVHDETYRKATKLDTDDFCTNFCPHDAGIIDIINQLLVPEVDVRRSVKPELYKLNVYSGPSGKFKAHVDTPRGETQVGSLVVCLPTAFEGECFINRHCSGQL